MIIEQIYTGCLAQGAYYIESNGEVAIIDPLREVQPYIDKATKNNAKIKYVFETHFHADFVSGHVTLAKQTGATIVYGPNAKTSFDALIAKDNQQFKVGRITIIALHTPGHTLESTTYLIKDEKGRDHAIFSGDTLFIGDVGRPDLAQKNGDVTEVDLAEHLYDSLRNKIMPLSDHIIVYPAHGAGSACGKNLSKLTKDTLGNQKKTNYALRADMSKAEFVKEVTEGLLPPPKYFPLNVKMNQEGYADIQDVISKGSEALSPENFETLANQAEALILDVRHQSEFIKGHIPRSIFIGVDGSFAPWVGALIADVSKPILLVVESGREEEVITRLSRVGFDNTLGYLKGGFKAWLDSGKDYDVIDSISAQAFEARYPNNEDVVFDVRKSNEFDASHVKGAKHTPLTHLNDYLAVFPTDKPFFVYCGGGYRSVITASIFKSRGVHNLVEIAGGYASIKKTDIPKTDFVCPSTLK